MLGYNKNLKKLSRNLRKNMTEAESLLWMHLRKRQVANTQFYPQKPMGNYIVDFYAPTARLVIELDGSHHYLEQEQIASDKVRDEALMKMNLQILRFNNLEVLYALESVLHIIFCKITGKPYVSRHGEYIEPW